MPLNTQGLASANFADVLMVEHEPITSSLVPALRRQYQVAVTPNIDTARQFIQRATARLVIVGLEAGNGHARDMCQEAKALEPAPAVLVMTAATELVPDALRAGCDSVLLKPFAPNLFYARVGRLLRAHRLMLQEQTELLRAKFEHLSQRSEMLLAGHPAVWPNTHCPYCEHHSVTSFDFASARRAWFACLQCKRVWIGKMN